MSVQESSIPELANIVSIAVHRLSDTALGAFLHHWENLIFSLIIVVFLSTIAFLAQRKRSLIPSGLQNLAEIAVDGLDNFFAQVMGKKENRRYLPYVGTLFIYILFMNFFGMVPGMKSPTSSLNTTIALALCTFVYVQFTGVQRLGILGYLDLGLTPDTEKDFKIFLLLLLSYPYPALLFILSGISEPVSYP